MAWTLFNDNILNSTNNLITSRHSITLLYSTCPQSSFLNFFIPVYFLTVCMIIKMCLSITEIDHKYLLKRDKQNIYLAGAQTRLGNCSEMSTWSYLTVLDHATSPIFFVRQAGPLSRIIYSLVGWLVSLLSQFSEMVVECRQGAGQPYSSFFAPPGRADWILALTVKWCFRSKGPL